MRNTQQVFMNDNTFTIYDVAREAGVSPATVSKVLNNRKGVGTATAQKIKNILAETGFCLKKQASYNRNIGIVMHPAAGAFLDSYTLQLVAKCYDEIMARNYSLQFINPQYNGSDSFLKNIFHNNDHLLGIIALASHQNFNFCKEVLEHSPKFPGVVIGKLNNVPINSIPAAGNHFWADDFSAGYQLATLFLRLNHKRYCIVTATLQDRGHMHRLEGIKAALSLGGITGDAVTVHEVKEDLCNSGNQLAMQVACRKNDYDAFIFTNGSICAGFVVGCVNMQLRIPEQFSVAGFEDGQELEHLPLPITAMHTPAALLASAAMNSLLAQLNGKAMPKPCMMHHRLCRRNTVCKR